MPARLDEAFSSSLDQMTRGPSLMGGGFNDNKSMLSSLESLKNPAFQQNQMVGGGWDPPLDQPCQELPGVKRPSLVQPYMSDHLSESRADLERAALTCSPQPFDDSVGTPKAYNTVKPHAPTPSSSSGLDCQVYLQHIWSCSECRHKLREFMGENEKTVTPSNQIDFNKLLPKVDSSDLLYYLLVGIGLLIFLDFLVRLAQRLR